jgi:radical SAM superfamily enzyme YgiQ (UPF0313 family)
MEQISTDQERQMKILLVYPEYPVTFWSFKHVLKLIGKKAAHPPLGLLTVAAMLPGDWDLRLVDMNVEKLGDADLTWADCVMVSAMSVQKQSTLEILERCRRLGVRTVAGGPLFTSTPEDYVDLVDHLVLDEAELTLPPFVADLKEGKPQKIYHSDEFPDLSLTPIPRWDLLRLDQYATLALQFSRGCPFDCEFCDITALYGRKPRLKREVQLLGELEAIYRLGWRGGVFLVDDNFIGHKGKIKKALPHLIQWMQAHDYPFAFITEASINLADDDELVELMVEANFDSVFIGLETPDEGSLAECSKLQNCGRDLVAAVKKLQAAGLQVLGGYIVGFDHDDRNIFSRQIKFIQESGVVTAMVGLLNAIPKTRLWERLKAENRLCPDMSGDNTDGSINFVPRMELDRLIEGYRKIVRTIYSPRYFYQRVCRFLEQYQPRRRHLSERSGIRSFLRSIFYLGVLGNGRSQWYFWKMLIRSLVRYPRLLPEIMTLMAYGHHFRKVAKRV